MAARHSHAQAGDLAHLLGPRGQTMTAQLTPGGRIETMHGILTHDDLIGQEWGSRVFSHLGKHFILLQPALDDVLRDIERVTQVVYPKDIGYILLSLGIGPGSRVLEAGTGSGALTAALAHAVGDQGHVFSYERRAETQVAARRNLEQLGLAQRVTFQVSDAADGFDEQDLQAVFLDLPNPEDYLAQVRAALQSGGFFGSLLPTTNQVSLLITALKQHDFGFLEVSEILHRYYQPIAARLRPVDNMTGHTGFLIFARKLVTGQNEAED
ncbi:MAG: tRNA (adenine-N1)-methyltransferase [Anaerolineales bacterium]|nr:tRNA (adenine-N1)-methyltransferase [Anaerolineales bacterium]